MLLPAHPPKKRASLCLIMNLGSATVVISVFFVRIYLCIFICSIIFFYPKGGRDELVPQRAITRVWNVLADCQQTWI